MNNSWKIKPKNYSFNILNQFKQGLGRYLNNSFSQILSIFFLGRKILCIKLKCKLTSIHFTLIRAHHKANKFENYISTYHSEKILGQCMKYKATSTEILRNQCPHMVKNLLSTDKLICICYKSCNELELMTAQICTSKYKCIRN